MRLIEHKIPIICSHTCQTLSTSKLGFHYHEITSASEQRQQQQHQKTISSHVITMMLTGELHINWGEHKDVTIKPGQMCLLPRGATVTGYIVEGSSYIEARIDRHMSSKEIEDIRQMVAVSGYKFKAFDMKPQMLSFAESVKGYLLDGVNCPHFHNAKLAELLVVLHWYYPGEDNAQLFFPMLDTISEFRSLILDNYQIKTSIEELVEMSMMSRSTFDRKFKENFGITPLKWIEDQTRQKIINKASEPNVTVKDIMHEIDIYNPSQFTRLCKRLTGVAPSQLIRIL